MAARKAKDIPTGGSGGGGVNWTKLAVGLLVALPAMVVLLPTTMLVFVLSLPTVVAFLVDRTRERYLVATVGLLNLCGVLPALVALWDRGQSIDNAFRLLTDMVYWIAAFGAAGVGWAIFTSLPPLVSSYYTLVTQHRVNHLRKRQKQLIEAWGEEVSGRHLDHERDGHESLLDAVPE
ncbi:hypothetical protein SAMN06265365_12190 [Tistlia consotensis]|uniref:Uncharacterized protein n=1 Tax=Tistlia consotensis USBA 355 TaxID=560819 RepID=A0A1Y6CGJ0_9PROT|nr:hypothetical protein [Tistlia consotensis]SMF60283.1 hypothetical protein SAMN05428998_12333 [Tistlia consotensis USBA 355]SNR93609.1 hypothetical protein SAMN06265365_12190 [Tistlia consotensis]